MTKRSVNIKSQKLCAFCKNWYDPTNSAINPKNPSGGVWEYDGDAKKKCLITNLDKHSWASCSKYIPKI